MSRLRACAVTAVSICGHDRPKHVLRQQLEMARHACARANCFIFAVDSLRQQGEEPRTGDEAAVYHVTAPKIRCKYSAS
jgi:hypothetical protein